MDAYELAERRVIERMSNTSPVYNTVSVTMPKIDISEADSPIPEVLRDYLSNELSYFEAMSRKADKYTQDLSKSSLEILSCLPFVPSEDFDSRFFESVEYSVNNTLENNGDLHFCLGILYACGFGIDRDMNAAERNLSASGKGQELSRIYRLFNYAGSHGKDDGYVNMVEAALSLCALRESMDSGEGDQDTICRFVDDYVKLDDPHLRNTVLLLVSKLAHLYHIKRIDRYISDKTKDPYLSMLLMNGQAEDRRVTLKLDCMSVSNDNCRDLARDILSDLEYSGEAIISLTQAISESYPDEVVIKRAARYALTSADLLYRYSINMAGLDDL